MGKKFFAYLPFPKWFFNFHRRQQIIYITYIYEIIWGIGTQIITLPWSVTVAPRWALILGKAEFFRFIRFIRVGPGLWYFSTSEFNVHRIVGTRGQTNHWNVHFNFDDFNLRRIHGDESVRVGVDVLLCRSSGNIAQSGVPVVYCAAQLYRMKYT